jgi:hypothetical protein
MLVLSISEDLNELFQNGRLATIAFRCELRGVMIMAVDLTVVFIVRILRAKHGRTNATCKVLDMVLAVQCSDIRSTQGLAAIMA